MRVYVFDFDNALVEILTREQAEALYLAGTGHAWPFVSFRGTRACRSSCIGCHECEPSIRHGCGA